VLTWSNAEIGARKIIAVAGGEEGSLVTSKIRQMGVGVEWIMIRVRIGPSSRPLCLSYGTKPERSRSRAFAS
jgi:hypothetical protein